jgi:hypothetical protein
VRRRDPGTTLDIGSLLVTTPRLTHVDAAAVPRRSQMQWPSPPYKPGTGRRPVRRAGTPPVPSARTARLDRPPPGAAPTPTPHETADQLRRAATPMATAHPHPCPAPTSAALRSSLARARSAPGTTGRRGRERESVDNTRRKRAAVDNPRNPPVPHHPFEAGSPTSRISCSAGSTAGHSSLEQGIRPVEAALQSAGGTTRTTTATTTGSLTTSRGVHKVR